MENLQMEHDKCKDLLGDAKYIESWKEETETMNQHIVQLEQQLKCCEGLKNINGDDKISNKDIETQPKACENCSLNAKDRRILALERQVTALKNSLKNHTSTTKSSEKDNSDEKTNVKVEESWKQEIEAKNQHIIELKQKVVLLENLLRKNVDAQKMRDLEKRINRKSKRIVELENAVGELEDFLKEDVKEMRDLRYQISLDKDCIMKMEKWIQKNNLMNAGIDKARIIELEEMVTNLEDYVKEHDIDGLKRKLQDRECRIVQLENQIFELRKLSKYEENKPVKDMPKVNFLSNNEVACELEEKEQKGVMHAVLEEVNKIQEYEQEESLKIKLQEKEQKMKEMGHDISEKDNRIQRYEQQIVEQQNKILKMEKEMAKIEEGFYETEIISALKKEIRLKNERVQELEMEVNSLETSLGERIDVAIEELIATLKEKEEIELQLKKNLADKENKLEELDAALRQSIAITDEIEAKLKNEKKLRKEADQRIAEIEEKIAVMQAASATKCITCKPLLYKIFKTEGKFGQSNQEKTVQLQELHQIKRDVLKAALSEKDAHLALLEHSGIQTPTQADEAAKLKADKKILLDRLREEDEKSIKLDLRETTSHLFQKIFKISDDSEDSSDNNNNNSFDDRFSRINSPKSVAVNDDNSPTSATTSCKYSTRTSLVSDMKDEDHS
ncbi:PREDICTED: putative leucine-rich repeat-containing protein DDB_G0290503 [Trachymyrmex cornetzi]|uniref:ELKS/Rab6-interacting/CAST family member 1 n=1 Tax=Trachymyrmex cornetzi TaxID=471704 RepID=A0A151JMA4_9HYME|nr:PREDICTED: putative leucine-rich repeat-containing protein DDB_G0290503 [Trachymyrmex cornetzi]KYN26914.1 ELKS/Rab6-interacting/CAST family member 1 [Trachymyrmex cornetzi]